MVRCIFFTSITNFACGFLLMFFLELNRKQSAALQCGILRSRAICTHFIRFSKSFFHSSETIQAKFVLFARYIIQSPHIIKSAEWRYHAFNWGLTDPANISISSNYMLKYREQLQLWLFQNKIEES